MMVLALLNPHTGQAQIANDLVVNDCWMMSCPGSSLQES